MVGEWIRTTGGLLGRTAPFVVARVLVQLGLSLAVGLGLALVFWAGRIGLGLMGRPAAGVVFLFGAMMVLATGWVAGRYVLYLVRAAHVAVIAGVVGGEDVPRGCGQIGWGWRRVRMRLGTVTGLFAIDAVIRGVLRGAHGGVSGFAGGLGWRVVAVAGGYAGEAAFGHLVRTPGDDVRRIVAEGLEWYARSWRKLVPSAAGVVAASIVVWGVVTAAVLSPAVAVALMASPDPGLRVVAVSAAVGVAIVAGAVLRWIVVTPLGTVAMVGGFLRSTGAGSGGEDEERES